MHAPDGFLNAGTAVATGAVSAGTRKRADTSSAIRFDAVNTTTGELQAQVRLYALPRQYPAVFGGAVNRSTVPRCRERMLR